jgi:Holliday junction resolvase
MGSARERRATLRSARELEGAAARRRAPPSSPALAGGEALAMLVRRGLRPRVAEPDLPFPDGLDAPAVERVAARLAHYAFRLFLRGAILAPGAFRPADATRYLDASQARRMAEDLVELGLAARAGRGRYRLARPARSFGGTLEWWVARELARRLGFDAVAGVKSGARGVGGDLDVVAAAEGKLVYVELKSSPPKHVAAEEVAAFARRARALRADVTVFAVDTALRLSDRVLPMLSAELALAGQPGRCLSRENWIVAPHVYAVNARQDLIENVGVAIADGLLSLGPPLR